MKLSKKITPRAPPLPKPGRPTVILADDHGIVAEGLKRMLEPDYDVVAIVRDGRALIDAAGALHPDVIVADISMPLLNGIDAIRQIRRQLPATRAICLTMHADRTYVAEAFEAGASGYVVKHSASEELRDALEAVLRGGTYVSPLVGGVGRTRKADGARRQAPRVRRVTPRQREVLQLVAEGYTGKHIARMLGLSPKTVEFHKYRLMRQLGLGSTAQLVHYAINHALTPKD